MLHFQRIHTETKDWHTRRVQYSAKDYVKAAGVTHFLQYTRNSIQTS